ncbi:MAG TPA: hypothetical protein VMN36_19045 [Verrucomicrobiales bacterium]|nr:hypothetical protein [Verrucomicrobiales bacterium]
MEASWSFLDKGSGQGSGWRNPGFDDSHWRVGPAPLGFGDDRVRTRIASGPEGARRPTAYFRTEFRVGDPAAFSQLELELQRDDGAVVYLNGAEIARSNMPAGEIRFDTRALNTVNDEAEEVFHGFLVPAEALRSGRNVVAAEVHQVNRTSSDLGFDLRLKGLGLAARKIPSAQDLDSVETALAIPAEARAVLWSARARLFQDAGLADRAEEAGQKLQAISIHFLLAASNAFNAEPGTEVSRVVFRYADGHSAILPLIDQENIADFWIYSRHTIDPARIAWVGNNTERQTEPFQLLHIVWRNPHPERRIATLDLESAMARAAPFIVAITLE